MVGRNINYCNKNGLFTRHSPFIRDAVTTLGNILHRMQAQQTKKRAMLRPLQVAHAVLSDLTSPQTQDDNPFS
jgi:hypothetical protein